MLLKNRAKALLSRLHVHKKSQPDIFIFTLPRSGSTLLAEVLNTDVSSKMSSEPFALHNDNRLVLEQYFDKGFLAERYVDLKPKERERLMKYLGDLSQGKTWNSFYWTDFFSKQHSFSTQRSIFKTHKLTYHFDDIMAALQNDFGIYLLRHPVSQALSRLRQGWPHYIEVYKKSDKIHPHLSKQAQQRISKIEKEGTDLEKMVLSWHLENYVFLKAWSMGDLSDQIVPVLYENLIGDSERTLTSICAKIRMEFSPEMLAVLRKPSSGIVHSSRETIGQINSNNHDFLLERWKKEQNEIDQDYLSEFQDILGLSGLKLY